MAWIWICRPYKNAFVGRMEKPTLHNMLCKLISQRTEKHHNTLIDEVGTKSVEPCNSYRDSNSIMMIQGIAENLRKSRINHLLFISFTPLIIVICTSHTIHSNVGRRSIVNPQNNIAFCSSETTEKFLRDYRRAITRLSSFVILKISCSTTRI